MENERRHNRESRRWPYAFGALLGGTLLGTLIVLAAKGPSVVVVNNKDNCCCCQQQRCANPLITSPKVGKLPRLREPGPNPVPCCDGPDAPGTPDIGDSDRIAGLIPFIPWINGGGNNNGGGSTRRYDDDMPVNEIPEPGTFALLASGALLFWRMS